MIVLDASVLIAFMFEQDAHHEAALELMTRLAADTFGASPLTLAEVLVVPTRLNRMPAAQQMLSDVGMAEIPFPPDAAAALAQLRADTGLKLPDCCVLLAAHLTAGTVATFDQRLAGVASDRGLVSVTG